MASINKFHRFFRDAVADGSMAKTFTEAVDANLIFDDVAVSEDLETEHGDHDIYGDSIDLHYVTQDPTYRLLQNAHVVGQQVARTRNHVAFDMLQSAYMNETAPALDIATGVLTLKDDGIETVDGYYNCYLSAKRLSSIWESARQDKHVRFVPTTMLPDDGPMLLLGKGALTKGDVTLAEDDRSYVVTRHRGAYMIAWPPTDPLNEVMTLSWSWRLDYAVPRDEYAYRRGIVVE